MEIRVQYNNDLAFRKWVAFQRIYRSKNVKKRVAVELGIAAAAALGAILLWISGTSAKNSIYFFYALVILAVVLLARFLRALVIQAADSQIHPRPGGPGIRIRFGGLYLRPPERGGRGAYHPVGRYRPGVYYRTGDFSSMHVPETLGGSGPYQTGGRGLERSDQAVEGKAACS